MDSDLSWREHIDYMYNKILRVCSIDRHTDTDETIPALNTIAGMYVVTS